MLTWILLVYRLLFSSLFAIHTHKNVNCWPLAACDPTTIYKYRIFSSLHVCVCVFIGHFFESIVNSIGVKPKDISFTVIYCTSFAWKFANKSASIHIHSQNCFYRQRHFGPIFMTLNDDNPFTEFCRHFSLLETSNHSCVRDTQKQGIQSISSADKTSTMNLESFSF